MIDALKHNAYAIKNKLEGEDRRTMHRIILVLTEVEGVLGAAHDAEDLFEEINEMEASGHE